MHTPHGSVLQPQVDHAESLNSSAPRRVAGPNPQVTARAAGVLVLMTIGGGVFAQGFVSNRLVSFSDAALTANNILTNQPLFQVSFTVYLIEMAC
ncbi:MAG TPA: hypothetical protein VF850_00330, partial [Gemmatimonadaceae bacterium]